jgi:ubiquinone/menaquinone biosynthesis C-methylase UbiE
MYKTAYICPKTGESLTLNVKEGLYCSNDKSRVYRIKNGVPFFANATSFGEKETQRVFGAEWQSFTEYDADNLEKMAYNLESFFKNKTVLEIGCGAGRHSRRLINLYGAAFVEAIDLSDAVFVAKKSNEDIPNINVTNANVFELPFKDESYDIGFSLGVLMHTTAPLRAFISMCKKVKKGGNAVIWVYAKTPRKYFMEFFRFFTKNSPTIIQKIIASILSYSLWPLVLLSKKISLSSHFQEYSKYDFYVYKTDMYDRISAPLIAFFSEKEIKQWFDDVGFDKIEITTYGDFFVRGVGLGKK